MLAILLNDIGKLQIHICLSSYKILPIIFVILSCGKMLDWLSFFSFLKSSGKVVLSVPTLYNVMKNLDKQI